MKKLVLILALLFWTVVAAGAKPPAATTTPAPMSATQARQQNAEASAENALISTVAAAEAEKDWPRAEAALQKLTALNPARWEYHQALADVQLNEGKYDSAVANYTSALVGAEKAKLDPRIKRAMALMYTSQGNAYLKLKRPDDALAAYNKAAAIADNPATAYFNVCAVLYNAGDAQHALPACDKAIAADPNKADAWFIKGSLLMGESSVDAAGKTMAPAGTVEALQKYLQLAPTGPHAGDVKQMLQFLGANPPG